jgi:rhodanese-related sulfurtransferase
MNSKLVLLILLVPLAVIAAIYSGNDSKQLEKKYDKLLEDVNTKTAFISTDNVADKLVKKDPSLLLVDVRSKDDYDEFHLPGAINIPLNKLYAEESLNQFGAFGIDYVLYSNGTTDAQSAWLLLRLKNYKNIFVLQGGANYWYETIINPVPPADVEADDEIAKYNFRKAANQYFTGSKGEGESVEAPKPANLPKRSTEKKRAAGGC